MAIDAEHSRAYAVLVARRVAKSIVQKQQRGHKARVIGFKSAKRQKDWSARPARTGAWAATSASATALGAWTGAKHRLRLHRQQAFALQLLAGELARAAFSRAFFSEGFS
jgi:hypothetical protein